MESTAHSRWMGRVAAALALALVAAALAWAGTSLCRYRFGVEDQAQYLVQLRAIEHPGAFASDPYLRSFASLGSVFWYGIAAISSPATHPSVVLTIHLGLAALHALVLAWACWPVMPRLAGRGAIRAVGSALIALIPALLLVVPKEQNWFGLVSLSDRELTATYAVLPLVAWHLGLIIRGRIWLALAVAALAVPIQGQTGAYLLTAWGLTALWQTRDRRAQLALVVGIGLVGAAGIAVLRARSAVPVDSLDAYEAIGMGLYPELINPLTAPLASWASVGALVGLGVLAAVRLGVCCARVAVSPTDAGLGRLGVWIIASLAFPAGGLALLALGVREPVLWKLMVGRSLMLAQIGSIVLISAWIARALTVSRRAWLGGLVVLGLMTAWPFASRHATVAAGGIGLLGVLIALVPIRPAPTCDPAGQTGCSPTGPCCAGCPKRAGAGVLVGIAIALTLGSLAFVERPYPWLASGEDHDWLEAQHWARDHTPPDAVFITPPYRSGWRVGSARSTIGEVKDGCLLFYAGTPALDWADRMHALGADAQTPFLEVYGLAGGGVRGRPRPTLDELRARYHAALDQDTLAQLARDGASYLVTERPGDPELGTPIWSNNSFVIRRLDAPGE